MSEAIPVQGGSPIRADQAKPYHAPFRCAGCGVLVGHVDGYTVHGDDPALARHVRAFFRLERNSEHDSGCRNTPTGQVRALVARAEAVENGINPFEQRGPNGMYVFRLNIPAEEIREEKASVPNMGIRESFKERKERVWTGRRLENYCRSAVGLAKIWQALESSQAETELRKHVRIAVAGKRVRWDDFFYSQQDAVRLIEALEVGCKHPVAVLLYLREAQDDRLIFTDIKSSSGPEQRIKITALVDKQSLGQVAAHHHYIVFGEFWLQGTGKPWHVPDSDRTIIYYNAWVRLYRTSQIRLIDVVIG